MAIAVDGSSPVPMSTISYAPLSPVTTTYTTTSIAGQLTVWQQPHFHLSKRCCLCERLYESRQDRIVAITSFEGALTHAEVAACHLRFPPQGNAIDAFSLAPYQYKSRTNANPPPSGCRRRDCSPANPETLRRRQIPTLHLSCFNRLTCLDGTSNVYKRFSWLMRCRSSPFAGAPRLHLKALSPYPIQAHSDSLRNVNLVSIQHFESPFWKLARAMEVAWRLTAMLQGSHGDLSMAAVKDWKRGAGYTRLKNPHERLRTVRITLDAYGINRIERLARKPDPFSEQKVDDRAYIVVDDWEIQGIYISAKWDLGRLVLPDHHPGLHVWDTPSPPHIEYYGPRNNGIPVNGATVVGTLVNDPNGDLYHLDQCEWMLQDCDLAGSPSVRMSRFYTIDVTSITGLTFMYGPDKGLVAIHGHTAARPDVEVPPEAPSHMHWIYVPVPEGDQILSIGAHVVRIGEGHIRTPAFRITTMLAGEVYVGPSHLFHTPMNIFSRDTQQLMYNRVDNQRGLGTVDMIGVYPKDPDRIISYDFTANLEANGIARVDSKPEHLSWAPLEGIARVRVYRHGNEEGPLQGMLIEYMNGAQRSMGTFRADSILAEECLYPAGISLYNFKRPEISVDPASKARLISFYDGVTAWHENPGWECYCMTGELQLTVRGEYSCLQVTQPQRPMYMIPIIEGGHVRYMWGA